MLTYSNGYWEVYGRFQEVFWLEAGVEKRGICWENFPSRNLSWGKKISIKGAQDLLAFLKKKNNEKIKMKVFFQLEVKSSIKT